MDGNDDNVGYKIWAVDNVVYGPVNLAILMHWTKEERITADTWLYVGAEDQWKKAADLAELSAFFGLTPDLNNVAVPPVASGSSPAAISLKPATLRRMKVFANLDDQQLERFKEYLMVQPARQWSVIVRQGDPGDAMYLVLEGEVRVRLMIGEKESIIATLPVGEFFGEFCLFDHGPRSADVVANSDAQLLKISASSFQRLLTSAPDLAAPFLTAICKTLAARIRADNKRYKDSISFARARQ